MRRDLKIKKVVESVASIMALIGLGGIAGAAEGQGNMIIAIGVFVIGFSVVLWGYQR